MHACINACMHAPRLTIKLMRIGAPKAHNAFAAHACNLIYYIIDRLISQAFIFLVVLVFFNSRMPAVKKPFEVVEFFSGTGNMGKSCRFGCMMTAQLDIEMGKSTPNGQWNAFDMTTPPGMALLSCMLDFPFTLSNNDQIIYLLIACLGLQFGYCYMQKLGTFSVCWLLFALLSQLAMWLHQSGVQWYHMVTPASSMFGLETAWQAGQFCWVPSCKCWVAAGS